MGSYEKINYDLRPAKCIERKMLCEAFRRLSAFGKIESYGYVGFGSTYFSDFSMFHKSLNLCNMTSIEQDEVNKERFEFNKPYSCIDIKYGKSTDVLPLLNWNSKKILWLDYDGKLSKEVLLDLDYFCVHAVSGSIVIISLNATPVANNEIPYEKLPKYRLKQLKIEIGENKVPTGTRGRNFAGWGTAKVCRNVIENEIMQILNARNADYEKGNKLSYRQLFNFHYSDGAKMLSTGGIIYEEGDANHLAQCSFDDLSFIRQGEQEYKIDVPNLTFKEIRHLNEQLPPKDQEDISAPAVKPSDAKKYEKIYRHFPSFTRAFKILCQLTKS